MRIVAWIGRQGGVWPQENYRRDEQARRKIGGTGEKEGRIVRACVCVCVCACVRARTCVCIFATKLWWINVSKTEDLQERGLEREGSGGKKVGPPIFWSIDAPLWRRSSGTRTHTHTHTHTHRRLWTRTSWSCVGMRCSDSFLHHLLHARHLVCDQWMVTSRCHAQHQLMRPAFQYHCFGRSR